MVLLLELVFNVEMTEVIFNDTAISNNRVYFMYGLLYSNTIVLGGRYENRDTISSKCPW